MDKNAKEWNKSKWLKEKKYLERFNRLNIYSFMENDKVSLGVKPEEINELFSNACGKRERLGNEKLNISVFTVNQSTMQYYMILGLQDFYQNHFIPLRDENITLKEEVNKTQTMLMNLKKKNDERFDIIMNHLMIISDRINKKIRVKNKE